MNEKLVNDFFAAITLKQWQERSPAYFRVMAAARKAGINETVITESYKEACDRRMRNEKKQPSNMFTL